MNIIDNDTNNCGIQFFLLVFVRMDIKKAAEPDASSLNTNNNQVYELTSEISNCTRSTKSFNLSSISSFVRLSNPSVPNFSTVKEAIAEP
jgi:hypothetical protein